MVRPAFWQCQALSRPGRNNTVERSQSLRRCTDFVSSVFDGICGDMNCRAGEAFMYNVPYRAGIYTGIMC